jgi:hypothetical protein
MAAKLGEQVSLIAKAACAVEVEEDSIDLLNYISSEFHEWVDALDYLQLMGQKVFPRLIGMVRSLKMPKR